MTCRVVEANLHYFWTSSLDRGEFHAPAALPPGDGPQVHIWQEAVWTPERGRGSQEKSLLYLLRIEPRPSSPLTDWATPAPPLLRSWYYYYYYYFYYLIRTWLIICCWATCTSPQRRLAQSLGWPPVPPFAGQSRKRTSNPASRILHEMSCKFPFS
jgi:hypothetical protein